jgi:uncharacterized protein YndB with AHSA1/START domain
MANKKKHDWTRFTVKIEIAAPLHRVFRAWTDTRSMRKWFFYDGVVEPRKSGKFGMVDVYGNLWEYSVLDARKDRMIRFAFGTKGEKVEVKFSKSPSGTDVLLTQYDMKTTPEDKWSMHMGCRLGWTFFLANLKAVLEHGIDLRGFNPKKGYNEGFINS